MRKFTSIVLSAFAVSALLLADAAQASPYSTAVLADNPVAYYRMNESSGTAAVDAVPGHSATSFNGTYVGGVTLGNAGPQSPTFAGFESNNKAPAGFDGGGAYMTTGTAISTLSATQYSYSIWFNSDGLDNGSTHFMAGRLAGPTSLVGDGLLEIGHSLRYWNGTAATGVFTFAAGVSGWHQAVLTRNGTNVNIYFDGALKLNVPTAPSNPYGSSNLFKVGLIDGTNWPFHGSLDELAVYNSELSGSQVLAEYQAAFTAPAVPEPGSVALLGIGSIGWFGMVRRRNRAST